MSVVVEYKYTPDQMPAEELRRSFRRATELTGPSPAPLAAAGAGQEFEQFSPGRSARGGQDDPGAHALRGDPRRSGIGRGVAAAPLPRGTVRGMFSSRPVGAAVRSLAEEGVAGAAGWSTRIEQAADDEESQSLAVAALRDIARAQGKRLVLFVENLNLLLSRAFDETSQATLRRLLMVDPFLMLIGTAVQMFEEVEEYDRVLFNYFHPLFLERSTTTRCASSWLEGGIRRKHGLPRNARGSPPQAPGAIASDGRQSAVHPHDLRDPQRRRSDQRSPDPPTAGGPVDPVAKARAGGTFRAAGQNPRCPDAGRRHRDARKFGQATRLKLNAVTVQLGRLKANRMVDVLGGGKGQTAHYTVPDQLFCTWYQMRYLRQNRRRIELFVEVIRLWFEAEERLQFMQRLAQRAAGSDNRQAHSLAEAVEYFAAALRGTAYQEDAKRLTSVTWLRTGDIVEAAKALLDLSLGLQDKELLHGFRRPCTLHLVSLQ